MSVVPGRRTCRGTRGDDPARGFPWPWHVPCCSRCIRFLFSSSRPDPSPGHPPPSARGFVFARDDLRPSLTFLGLVHTANHGEKVRRPGGLIFLCSCDWLVL